MVLMKGKVKDKEHLKLRCLVQVGPGPSSGLYNHSAQRLPQRENLALWKFTIWSLCIVSRSMANTFSFWNDR